MNLKAIIQKIASWFCGEAKVVEQDAIKAVSGAWELTEEELAIHLEYIINKGKTMSTPAATPAVDTNKAVAIALALKAIDASLTVEQVQAATNAALSALQPQVAA